jgi:hypothetical protein
MRRQTDLPDQFKPDPIFFGMLACLTHLSLD